VACLIDSLRGERERFTSIDDFSPMHVSSLSELKLILGDLAQSGR